MKKVGIVDNYAIYRTESGQLLKAVPGEVVSDDLYSFTLGCVLMVDLHSDIPQDIRISGVSRMDLPDVIDFEFKGVNGEIYAGEVEGGYE